ncbi:MAG: Flp pilus assembly protein CpaB [Terracidiphilus sp.]|jgi:pilus assembly protein CpaB
MNRRLLTILFVAFIVAVIFTYIVARVIHNQSQAQRAPATVRVVAAKTDIKLGTILSQDNLTTVEIAGVAPKGAILARDGGSALGRGVISDLYEGEPIIDARLAPAGSGGGLAATIPQGMRACAVKVDDVVNVSGFVTPGMRVDVIISGTPPGAQSSTQAQVSRTLLQNIQVLSAGTEFQKDTDGKAKQVTVVNLLVSPEQAETLSLASNFSIRLVLRNPLDTKVGQVASTDTNSLFGSVVAPPTTPTKHVVLPKTSAPEPFTIEVLNGSKSTQEKFASPGGHQ